MTCYERSGKMPLITMSGVSSSVGSSPVPARQVLGSQMMKFRAGLRCTSHIGRPLANYLQSKTSQLQTAKSVLVLFILFFLFLVLVGSLRLFS